MSSISQEFLTKVKEIGKRLGIDYRYLLSVMQFESGLNPQAINKWTKATGLIQFMPSTAHELGTTCDELYKMTDVQQLDYVEKYFNPYKGKLDSLSEVYMAVLWPRAALDKDQDSTLFIKGTKAYDQNPMDWNKDGRVTETEAAAKVQKYFDEIYSKYPKE